jgi:hypothetical protein
MTRPTERTQAALALTERLGRWCEAGNVLVEAADRRERAKLAFLEADQDIKSLAKSCRQEALREAIARSIHALGLLTLESASLLEASSRHGMAKLAFKEAEVGLLTLESASLLEASRRREMAKLAFDEAAEQARIERRGFGS